MIYMGKGEGGGNKFIILDQIFRSSKRLQAEIWVGLHAFFGGKSSNFRSKKREFFFTLKMAHAIWVGLHVTRREGGGI